jgi:hypothetical protein
MTDDPPLTTFLDEDLPRRLRALDPHDPDLIRAAALIEDMTPVYRAAEAWWLEGSPSRHETNGLITAVAEFRASNPDTNY